MLKPEDRPVVFALLAVAFALFVNVAVSPLAASQSDQQQRPKQTGNSAPERVAPFETETFWVFMGFIATCVIAIYGIRQFEEGRRSSERELRAYLSVVIGGGTYQERLKKLRFEANPLILNNGATPAYNVRYSAIAKIIPDRIALTYNFKIPAAPPISQASIGPKENRSMSALYRWTVPDKRAEKAFLGDGSALWVWGIVEYVDAFERPRYTEFCQRLEWRADGKGGWTVFGRYDPRLGRST